MTTFHVREQRARRAARAAELTFSKTRLGKFPYILTDWLYMGCAKRTVDRVWDRKGLRAGKITTTCNGGSRVMPLTCPDDAARGIEAFLAPPTVQELRSRKRIMARYEKLREGVR